MLTANRFDEIKKFTVSLHGTQVTDLSLGDISKMAVMLAELCAEIERLRRVPEIGGRGHIKPVILDAQGQAVVPPPIAHQLVVERREQYDIDRFEAIMAIPDLAPWRLFSLRWGLAPPPGGWEDTATILNVIHAVRLGIKEVPLFQKTISASWITSNQRQLPPGVRLVNGSLTGVELPD